jgi:Zn-finger nucleic acid-binding protein
VWVDETGLGAVRERLFATILQQSAPRAAPPRASAALACPHCNETMTVTQVGGAEVDICPGHGTWFDSGELELLAHSIAVAKNRAALGDPADASLAFAERGGSSSVRATVDHLNAQLSRSINRVEQMVEMQRLRDEALRYRHR